MSDLNVIAFYLPQFHRFKENDEWWGRGFTEWTNVGKAKPLFSGHYQPRVPADLGYYDLRLRDVRQEQAELAKEAGITAFCYWHYWFDGKQLMNDIFDDVLASGEPDFKFCLGWANHSWYAKTWDKNSPDKLLIKQTYSGKEDMENHFGYLLKAFRDERYLKIDGKPFLSIYDSEDLPKSYIESFRKWTIDAGFRGLYIVGYLERSTSDLNKVLKKGIDSVVYSRYKELDDRIMKNLGRWGYRMSNLKAMINEKIFHLPARVLDFRKTYKFLITDVEKDERVIPQILTGFDHSPRSGRGGYILQHYTPDYLYLHAKEALEAVKNKKNKIVIVKSWNEWAEGNYLEPDLKYGHQFIQVLRKAIDEFKVSNM